MARKPRLHYPGACYHVILRGNAGNDIFFSKKDRSRFFLLLQEGIERYKYRIHAYCLMTNHVHLAVQVGEIPLSRIVQNVSFRYTRYLNYNKSQFGHVFQGRYKALLIDGDRYLLELVRYIHNNPVRAGVVETPLQYPWSSHSAYLGKVQVPWLSTDFVLSQFAGKLEQAIEEFRNFVLKGKDEGHRQEFHRGNVEGRILGEDRFAEDALRRGAQKVTNRVSIPQLIEAVCRVYGISPGSLASNSRAQKITEPRSVAALLVRETDHLSLMALSQELKRDLSGLSQAASRLEKKLTKDDNLLAKLNKIKAIVPNAH